MGPQRPHNCAYLETYETIVARACDVQTKVWSTGGWPENRIPVIPSGWYTYSLKAAKKRVFLCSRAHEIEKTPKVWLFLTTT